MYLPGFHSVELCTVDGSCSSELLRLLFYDQPPVLLSSAVVISGEVVLVHLVGIGFMPQCGESAARCRLGLSLFWNANVTNTTSATCYGRRRNIDKGSDDFVLSFASDGQHFDSLAYEPIIITLPTETTTATDDQSSIRWWWLLAAIPTGLVMAGCVVALFIKECVTKQENARYTREMEVSQYNGLGGL